MKSCTFFQRKMYQSFNERKIHPRENANFFSIITFIYTIPSFFKGYKKDFEEEDICDVVTCCRSTSLADRLEKEWNAELLKQKRSVVRTIWRVFGKEYCILGFAQLTLKTTLLVLRPILLGKLVAYFSPNQTAVTKEEAYGYAFGVILVTILSSVYLHAYMFYIQQLGLKIRIAVCSLIYRKSLNLSREAINEITNGNIVTLVSKDVYSFESAIMFLHDLWIGVVQIIIMTYVMYRQIGWSSVVGISFLVMLIPFQLYLGKVIQKTRLKAAAKTDERVRLIQEILVSIKIIKMYVWESFFANKISEQRKAEMIKLRIIFYLKTIIFSLGALSTRLSFYLCVLIYVSLENTLTPEKAFVVIGSYAALRSVITVSIPIGIAQIAEAKTSIKRIKRVLLAEEITKLPQNADGDAPKITIKDCTVTIDNKSVLEVSNLSLEKGLLIGLTGPVGSGKSTLLKLILRDTKITKGIVNISGNISYASQEPWLFPGTIKQNILFGEALDEQRYDSVIKICALRLDLENLPDGDGLVVMDKGSNLSKGQQTRINLARAIYRQADIYLLDDSLSNLDSTVSRYIFNNAIKNFLGNKLIVMVSHQKNFLKDMDKIIVLEKGRIQNIVGSKDIDAIKIESPSSFERTPQEDINRLSLLISSTIKLSNDDEILDEETEQLLHQSGYGIYHEKKKQGKVDFSIYMHYFKAGGGFPMLFLIVIIFGLGQLSASWFDFFISSWVDSEQKLASFEAQNQTENSTYIELKEADSNSLMYYSILISLTTIFMLAQSFSHFYFTTKASIKLHKKAFGKVIQAAMEFFDLHLAGNIVNRFSKDIGLIDEFLPFVIFECIRVSFILIGVVFVISIVNPYFIILSVVTLVLLYLMKVLYLPTGRSLKRLDNATRSPVVGHINSSLEGLSTIRGSRAQGVLKIQFDHHQDLNSSASYMYMTQSRAFGFFLDMLCGILVAIIVLTFLFFDTRALAGKVGLAVSQATLLTGLLQWGIRQWAELENCMTSVERVVEYSKANIEPKKNKYVENWPKDGKISFNNVRMRYVKSLSPVLRNISFSVKPQEKIGIIGRTGAGKSSIISALFKLYNVDGSIEIDGVDLKAISFENLRRKISIIPQDPLLFVGTLRDNLDPYNEYSDPELWNSLRRVDLKPFVENLEMNVTEGGAPFSAGQKQLICMARAILKNNKILVLDEATANVDPETDALIQQTIRKKFSDCTILIIAHRLDNVMDCDKVMVLERGSIIEFGGPDELLKNDEGHFYAMVKAAGDRKSVV